MRRTLTLGAAFTLLAGASAAAQQAPADAERQTTQAFRYMMGTEVAVQAVGGDDATRAAAIEEAYAAFAEVDRLMSNYREDSELMRVNRTAAKAPVPVSDPLLAVLRAALEVSSKSDGAFDVTVGPLVRLWGFHDKKPHLPSEQELQQVRPLVGFQGLLIDDDAGTVRFAREGMEIDLGGIGKGFAVELAAGVLRRRGLAGMIDAGGNLYLLGRPAGKRAWSVGIRDPTAEGRLLGVLEAPEGSLSTSAAYATFLVADGKRYGHILDPRTLRPSEAVQSATVVSPDGTLADALSKVGFVLGPERGLRVIESFSAAGLIAYRTPDGGTAVVMSDSLKPRFRRAPGG